MLYNDPKSDYTYIAHDRNLVESTRLITFDFFEPLFIWFRLISLFYVTYREYVKSNNYMKHAQLL